MRRRHSLGVRPVLPAAKGCGTVRVLPGLSLSRVSNVHAEWSSCTTPPHAVAPTPFSRFPLPPYRLYQLPPTPVCPQGFDLNDHAPPALQLPAFSEEFKERGDPLPLAAAQVEGLQLLERQLGDQPVGLDCVLLLLVIAIGCSLLRAAARIGRRRRQQAQFCEGLDVGTNGRERPGGERLSVGSLVGWQCNGCFQSKEEHTPSNPPNRPSNRPPNPPRQRQLVVKHHQAAVGGLLDVKLQVVKV